MPAQRVFLVAFLGAFILAIAAAVPWFAQAALALDAVLLVAFVVDLRRAGALPLSAVREWPPLLVQGAPAHVTVWLSAPWGAHLRAREALAPGLAEQPLHATFEVRPGERVPWR